MLLYVLDFLVNLNLGGLAVVKFYKLKWLNDCLRGEVLVKDEEMLEELKKIRELLAAKPPAPPPPPKGLWNEFKAFIENYKVLGLAVAFILGLYLGQLVQSMVTYLIMPIIGLALPGMDNLSTLNIPVGTQEFGVGGFLVALITFIIVAFVIFILVKLTKKWGIQ
jgi:large conductance mechanosensitive channel